MLKIIILGIVCSVVSQVKAELPENYQELSAVQKQEILWNNITSNLYTSELPTKVIGPLELLSKAKVSWMLPAFNRVSDEMIETGRDEQGNQEFRQKIFHALGTIAKIKWVSTSQKYSGIFSTGGIGLLRESAAGSVSKKGMTPGMAIKILVDGQPSVNLHVMKGLTFISDKCDPFSEVFSNKIEGVGFPLNLLIGAFFKTVRKAGDEDSSPFKMVVKHFARTNVEEGTEVSPDVLFFKPTSAVTNLGFSCSEDWRTLISKVNPGTVLYEVFAEDTQNKIGEIVLDSNFVSTKYGDEGIYFQHNLL